MRTQQGVPNFARPTTRPTRACDRACARCLLILIGITACTDAPSAPAKPVQLVSALSIMPAEVPSLALGQLVVLQASARDEKGVAVVSAPVSWTSSEPGLVRIQPGPANSMYTSITALRSGVTTMTARSGQGTANVTIVVHAPGPVATVFLLSENELAIGKTVQLTVVQRDSDGVVLTAPVPVFSSSDSTIARVSGTGVVTALAEGKVTMTAVANGKSGSKKLSVIASEHAFMWTATTGMIDLGVLPGFVSSRALAVSSAGHVVGTVTTIANSRTRAFVRTPGASGVMRELDGFPGGGSTEAFGVNGGGQAVGYATTATGVKHAVLWRPAGELVDLGTINGGQESIALGINDGGQVVGWTNSESLIHPFIWTESAGMRIIPGATTFTNGTAFAINQSGVIAGEINERPVTWNPSSAPSELPLLSGDAAGSARAISNAGEMVGTSSGCDAGGGYYYYDECNPVARPVTWTGASMPVDLRRNSGSATTIVAALGINSAHQIVGSATNSHAILWSAEGLRDLGVLPGRLWSSATAINDAGVVVGFSSNP